MPKDVNLSLQGSVYDPYRKANGRGLLKKPPYLRASTTEELEETKRKDIERRRQHPYMAKVEDFAEGTANFLKGFVGVESALDDPDKNVSYPKAAGEAFSLFDEPAKAVKLLGAIPFPFGKKIFHGTKVPERFEYFDPRKNTGDYMSTKIHFSENPDQAANVANEIKPGRPEQRDKDLRIIPAKLKATRALDTYDLEGVGSEDVARLYGAAEDEWSRKSLKETYLKYNRKKNELGPENYLTADARDNFKYALRNHQDNFDKAGFDALRYDDLGYPTWAIADPTLAETPWGTPLGKPVEKKKRFLASPEGIIDTNDWGQVAKAREMNAPLEGTYATSWYKDTEPYESFNLNKQKMPWETGEFGYGKQVKGSPDDISKVYQISDKSGNLDELTGNDLLEMYPDAVTADDAAHFYVQDMKSQHGDTGQSYKLKASGLNEADVYGNKQFNPGTYGKAGGYEIYKSGDKWKILTPEGKPLTGVMGQESSFDDINDAKQTMEAWAANSTSVGKPKLKASKPPSLTAEYAKNMEINNAYSPQEVVDMVQEAQTFGLNIADYENYMKLEDAILDAKLKQGKYSQMKPNTASKMKETKKKLGGSGWVIE